MTSFNELLAALKNTNSAFNTLFNQNNPYGILIVPQHNASEAKKQFKKLSLQYHPDKILDQLDNASECSVEQKNELREIAGQIQKNLNWAYKTLENGGATARYLPSFFSQSDLPNNSSRAHIEDVFKEKLGGEKYQLLTVLYILCRSENPHRVEIRNTLKPETLSFLHEQADLFNAYLEHQQKQYMSESHKKKYTFEYFDKSKDTEKSFQAIWVEKVLVNAMDYWSEVCVLPYIEAIDPVILKDLSKRIGYLAYDIYFNGEKTYIKHTTQFVMGAGLTGACLVGGATYLITRSVDVTEFTFLAGALLGTGIGALLAPIYAGTRVLIEYAKEAYFNLKISSLDSKEANKNSSIYQFFADQMDRTFRGKRPSIERYDYSDLEIGRSREAEALLDSQASSSVARYGSINHA